MMILKWPNKITIWALRVCSFWEQNVPLRFISVAPYLRALSECLIIGSHRTLMGGTVCIYRDTLLDHTRPGARPGQSNNGGMGWHNTRVKMYLGNIQEACDGFFSATRELASDICVMTWLGSVPHGALVITSACWCTNSWIISPLASLFNLKTHGYRFRCSMSGMVIIRNHTKSLATIGTYLCNSLPHLVR